MNYCPNNTLTHYTTKLPKITDLDRAWKIGLAEIQYTHSWYSVMNNEAWLKVHFYKESELQNIWSCYRMGTIPRPKGFPIEGKKHKINHKIDMKVKKKLSSHHQSFNTIHVRIQTSYIPGGDYVSDWVVDVKKGLNSLYMYFPLVESRMVGDAHVPSLRIVPVEGRDEEMITRVIDPIQYCPLLQRFQTVEIDIRDDTGTIVPFDRGRVVVTLHCKKRKEFSLE